MRPTFTCGYWVLEERLRRTRHEWLTPISLHFSAHQSQPTLWKPHQHLGLCTQDYLELKCSYQQVRHVKTGLPEHQEPVINHLGFCWNDGAVTESLEDTERARCEAASLDSGAQRSAPKRQSFSEAEPSGYLAWEPAQASPPCSCGLRKLHVSSVLASFSHSQSCVIGNKLCEIMLQKTFWKNKKFVSVSIFCSPVSRTFPCVQKSVISLFTDCSWTSSPLYY